jgi:signal peptidase
MKKAWKIISTVFVWIVVIAAVSMMIFTIVSVNTFNRNDRNIFGLRFYIVLSDSMSATDFNAGDLILVKEVDPRTLQPGDIIAYTSQNTESYGQTITHKIRRLTTDAEGNPGFVTYGTTTDTDDKTIVTYTYILGKYQSHIPHLGTFFNFLKTTQGYFICIFTPFMLIILYEAVKFFALFRKYKKEQMNEMQVELSKIEAEREANAKLLEELQALKAQLEAGRAAPAEEPASEAAEIAEQPAEANEEEING